MMRIIFFMTLSLCLMLNACRQADASQNTPKRSESTTSATKQGQMLLAFYNVENLFDTDDQPDKIDEDFLPGGRYQWDGEKYQRKLQNLAKAIHAMGTAGPDLLGLAEVENAKVVADLIKQSPLDQHGYQFVHEESPDMRGIDVALVYDPAWFQYESHEAYEIYFPTEPEYTSRKVLMVKGLVGGEALYVFVNHWPSRRGGQAESESRRLTVAKKVKEVIDDIYRDDAEAKIILMGDFNDDPFNKSVAEVIGALQSADNIADQAFFNPLWNQHKPEDSGTLTYKGKWNLFDMLLVNENLLGEASALHYVSESAQIHRPEFMQVGGSGYAKDMPRRAIYRGEFRDNGFSDHFPVYLFLEVPD